MTTFKSLKPTNQTIVSKMVPPPNTNLDDFYVVSKRNPLRHYRRQLVGTNTSNLLIQPVFDVPGNSIVKSTDGCPKCMKENDDPLFFSEEIYPNKLNDCYIDCSGYQSNDPTLWKYNCCNPENNIIRSANTNLSKKYSTTNREFLKNRCKTFKSNLYTDISNCSRDCNNCGNTSTPNKINSTGNINNAIGGTSMSAHIYKRSFRDINSNSINNNNTGLCCPETPGKILYKNNNNICRVNDYPNLSRRAILCSLRR